MSKQSLILGALIVLTHSVPLVSAYRLNFLLCCAEEPAIQQVLSNTVCFNMASSEKAAVQRLKRWPMSASGRLRLRGHP